MATKKKAPKGKKKSAPASEKRPPKMRQTRIPGTEGDVDPEVHAAGQLYTKKRDHRMDASVEEKGAKVALINTMKRKGVTIYKDMEADPPVVIVLSSKDDVKVTPLGDDDPEIAELPDAGDDEEGDELPTAEDDAEEAGEPPELLEAAARANRGGDGDEPPRAA